MRDELTEHRRWEVVAMLWCAYVLYQADKQIYAVVLPLIRSEMGLSGYEAGLVNSAFTVVSAILAPLAGAYGDRWPKHRVLVAAVAIWSVATMLTGLVSSLVLLFIVRSILFAGAEAFYPPVSHAYLAEVHTRTRALAISIHQTAQNAGPLVSGVLAGWLAERFAGVASPEEARKIASDVLAKQVEGLIAGGVKHIHVFTLNDAAMTEELCRGVGLGAGAARAA